MPNLIAIDTNILVLLTIGWTNRKYISIHKRCTTFDEKDFQIITEIISTYDRILVTPAVLAETSNLIRNVSEPMRSEIGAVFARLVKTVDEQSQASAMLVDHQSFLRLGLTDVGLLTAVGEGAHLMTVDMDLYIQASHQGSVATNYCHIQERRSDFT